MTSGPLEMGKCTNDWTNFGIGKCPQNPFYSVILTINFIVMC
jgi:hypothetical protein